MRGCGHSTSVRLKVAEIIVAGDTCSASSTPRSHQTSALPSPGLDSTLLRLSFQEEEASSQRESPWGREQRWRPAGGRGTECEGPQLGSVTHWHYWCWADGRSGFQFSFSTDTWALVTLPQDWHFDAVGRALAGLGSGHYPSWSWVHC